MVGRCLVTVFFFSLLALAFIGQMPVVAAHNLGINLSKSADYGILYACFGMGALTGAISIGTGLRPHLQAPARAGLPRRLLAVTAASSHCNGALAGGRRRGGHGCLLLRVHHGPQHHTAVPAATRTSAAGSWRCG